MKLKLLIALLPTILLTGCSADIGKPEIVIRSTSSLNGSDKAAKFIIDCATAANPLSDEEGEDLVEQCQRTAYHLFATKEYYGYFDDNLYVDLCVSGSRKVTVKCMQQELELKMNEQGE